MNTCVDNEGREYDLSRWHKLSISQTFDERQPNHFGTSLATRQPIEVGDFVGDTRLGGSCNVNEIRTIPHCNGTHTESVGHIVDQPFPVSELPIPPLMPALLLSVEPVPATQTSENTTPLACPEDFLITEKSLNDLAKNADLNKISALIIRTLPNDEEKPQRKYGQGCEPAFFSAQAIDWIADQGIEHLLIDLPSIDKSNDGGLLTGHHRFWNVPESAHQTKQSSNVNKSITELIYVPDRIVDGNYLLNLQLADWVNNAVVSRPIIFELVKK